MDRVKGKIAIVTGGALGIGRACALLLAREGAKVAVTDIDDGNGNAVVREIEAGGGQALYLHHDVAREADWESVVAQTVQRFGGLHILVNNAGIAAGGGNVEQASLADWRRLMSINLDGVFLGMKHGIAAMRRTGQGGSVVNLSSILGLVGAAEHPAYNASKGGVRLATKSAALHCAQERLGIRVNSVHPGYIWTPMVENYLKTLPDPEAARTAVAALHPVGHMGEADDIAYGVLYLASDEAKFVTGAELVIDGGYTAQ
jgi:NAD(P)-dependent dehydrogenase (short-subunit alcohol dehydrogenase family)